MKPNANAPAAGTRPEGAGNDVEASRRVRELFGAIAPRYDLLNHLLSFSCDRLWRWRAARRVGRALRARARVLDLCCGTGDLAFALEDEAKRQGGGAQIVAADFVPAMLVRARRKAAERSSGAGFVAADALHLPFPDASFDLVALAFGFRNLANYAKGIAELRRVLRPEGVLAILEFGEPPGRLFGGLYRFYFQRILPAIGGWVSGSRSAYGYLPASVARFPSPEELTLQLRAAGFASVQFERWSAGIVAFHLAERPAAPRQGRPELGAASGETDLTLRPSEGWMS